MKKNGVTAALFLIGLGWCAPSTLVAGSASSRVQVKTVSIDPAIARLSDEELIDRLQEEKQRAIHDTQTASHVEQPALLRVFLPVDAPARFEENLTPVPRSAVMTELVRRGATALPALLQHLTDDRPTHLFRRGPNIGRVIFGNNYEPRYSDPKRQPININTVDPLAPQGVRSLTPHSIYIFKVGDLCYRVIGQIVNREIGPLARRPGLALGGMSVISSPVLDPALAAAARADWSGLTVRELEQCLRNDALDIDPQGFLTARSWGAIRRLLFYYPDAGREVAESLLRRTLVDDPGMQTLGPNRVTCSGQAELVAELDSVQWDGLDETVLAIYRSAIERHPGTALARLYRDNLAFRCAKRLAGHGHDREFADFFEKRVEANVAALRDPARNPLRYALTEANNHYRILLRKLNAVDSNSGSSRKS